MKKSLFIVLIVITLGTTFLSSCKGYRIEAEPGVEIREKDGRVTRYSIKLVIDRIERGSGVPAPSKLEGSDADKVKKELEEFGKKHTLNLKIEQCQGHKACLKVDGKEYRVDKGEELNALYKYVKEKFDKLKGGEKKTL
ncbi:MAG: hypothetical protein KDD43_00155 [Bdellovibrionales bacterium]|nr:hypothetical protein [Bdellovibrionales bacterium]